MRRDICGDTICAKIDKAWRALKPFVHIGDFTLRSGRKSNLYIDVKGALLSSEGYKISNGLTQLLECAGETKKVFADKDGSVHAFGYGYGGVILCAQYLHSTVFRGEKKEHGLGNEPIGRVPEEFNHFMILEDVVTTESSVRACLDEIVTHYYAREESLENIPVFCVVDRRQEEDIKLKNVYALFTEKEILERIKEDGLFFSPI